MIFFGWGHQTTKNYGPTFKNRCSHCNNEEYWILNRLITWFTLYFIPVIPYEYKYFLSCPICQYGLVLNKEQINQMRPLAEANQLLIDGNISQVEYQSRLGLTDGNTHEDTEQQAPQENDPGSRDAKLQYCVDCGQTVVSEIKFCGNCGNKIAPT